ncbi:MAG: LysR family transcriptional regulator [Clostridiales bacterium]|nr:LysR family transcriptional regulator [Candidatus Cacconaster stercorequi]
MTLMQMNYILEIYRCGSMNKAAQNLFVSQSAVSNAIRELEEELGVTIFHRSNRGISLTEDGRELVAQITPIVERSRKILRYYGERRAENRVKLSIATQRYPFCAKAFVEFLHLLNEPRIEVSLKETEMSDVIDEVASRQSDVGIIFVSDMTENFIRRILESKNLEFHELVKVRPHVFMRKGHPLAGEESVRLEQLRQYPYVVFTQKESNLHYAEEAVVGTGADFNQVVYVSDRATIYNVMAHTNCVSTGSGILPMGYGDERLVTIPLAEPVDDMRLGYIKLRGLPLDEQSDRFIGILEQITDELGEKI